MTPVLQVGDLLWHQVTDWRVGQRVRRTFSRVGRRSDCTTLYCGWRNELKPGEPLPVFVLLDRSSKVREVVYADMGEDDIVEALTLGIGSDLRPRESNVISAIGALALLDVDEKDGTASYASILDFAAEYIFANEAAVRSRNSSRSLGSWMLARGIRPAFNFPAKGGVIYLREQVEAHLEMKAPASASR